MGKTKLQTGARIFISHSWEDSDTRELCTHLPPRLEQKGYDVLIDRLKIKAGEMWRPKINGWLCECEGAVVLISPSALKSSWVLYEYSILAWRKHLQPGFNLLVVLLGRLTSAELNQGYLKAHQLGEVQVIEQRQKTGAALAAEIAKACAALPWQQLSCDMQVWVSNIARCLRQASSRQIEETLLHIFGVKEPTARLFAQKEELAAYQLLHSRGEPVVQFLCNIVDSMRNEEFTDLKRFLKPIWVDPRAAGSIVYIAHHDTALKILKINTDDTDIGPGQNHLVLNKELVNICIVLDKLTYC